VKVIFLDIDGVLNCSRTLNPRKLPYIVDPKLLALFKHVVEQTGAHVVLSSTWRYDPAGLFSARHSGIPFDDVIPDLPDEPRRKEILAWLEGHPVERYAVLDDEDDGLDKLPLFQPSSVTGLSREIAQGLTEYLNGQRDHDMRYNRIVRIFQNLHALLKGHEG
jgi:hypothetical protein